MTRPTDDEPNILSRCFRQTTNCYKHYWLLALLELATERDHGDDSVPLHLPYRDLAMRMVALAWFPVNAFKINFGSQDQLALTVREVAIDSYLKESASTKDIVSYMADNWTHLRPKVLSLIRYVPYRFLTPWVEKEVRGVKDSERNRKISRCAETAFFSSSHPLPYRFGSVEADEGVFLHPSWRTRLRRNRLLIESYSLWSLFLFLAKRNSNMTNLPQKLLSPKRRNLEQAKGIWSGLLKKGIASDCIYSGTPIDPDSFSLDHFIPWSFVAHDEIWNTIPTTRSVNSAKSDYIPSLENYARPFARVQFQLWRELAMGHEMGKREVASFLGAHSIREISVLAQIESRQFQTDFIRRLSWLEANASAVGFSAGWIYS